MLQVWLLGQFGVQADGKRVNIPSRAGQSLFAYLLLTAGTAHRREKLAGLLWPDVSDEDARRNLRQELWRIRKAISTQQPSGPEYLIAEDITIAFNAQCDYWLDVAELERALAAESSAGELIHQISLYRGDLLPGFYDDWVVLERQRIQALFEQRIQEVLGRLIAEQRWTAVLEWSERWIALEQSPEPAYRALMVAYAALGDRSKVASTFERCRETLARELDVEPSPETRTLYEQLVRGESAGSVDLKSNQVAPNQARRFDEPPTPGDPPFKGLSYFEEKDADLFFGREQLTAQMIGRLRDYPLLAVVLGASGSGKSSIVRAGLIAALKRGAVLADGTLPPDGSPEWPTHILTPTTHPLQALAVSLTRDSESVTATATLLDDLARDPRSLHLYIKRHVARARPASRQIRHLLVVDQFEELFTLCQDEYEREAFIDNLLMAADPGLDGRTTVVIAIRADFYSHLAQYENLREAVSKHQEFIGPMSPDELRRAIEGPALEGGWEFEPGLVDLILRDVGDEPGALPLLSHALLETWKRRSGRTLTLKGYNDAGGVRGAIAQTAELVYQALTPEQQAIAHNIFMRLTELGEGTEDTRRRAAIDELISRPEEGASVRAVLTTLADARLITLGEGTAEVAHEALIREWPALREWLGQDREGLVLHRRLTLAAQEWELLEREAGALYRGARLAQINEWASTHPERLNEMERAFLLASTRQEEQEEAEREAQRRRELVVARQMADTAQKLADTETRRAGEQTRMAARLRRRALALGGAFLLAVVLAGIALLLGDQARTSAKTAEANSRAASVARAEALTQQRLATSRELAAASASNLSVDPERSVLLALQAVDVTFSVDKTWTREAEEALHRAVQSSRVVLTLSGHTDSVISASFSPDGRRIATASSDKTAEIWDATTGHELLTLQGHRADVNTANFSPDGKLIVTSSDDHTSKVWDAATGQELYTLKGHTDAVSSAIFSPDGRKLATGSLDKTARLWDAATGAELLTLQGHTDGIRSIAFSPDGTRLGTASLDGTARVWDTTTGQELLTFSGHMDGVLGIAWSPDGKRLATASADDTAKIWDAGTGAQVTSFTSHMNVVQGIAFSPDGTRVATSSYDGTAREWDAGTGKELFALRGHTKAVYGIAFSPDGARLVTASDDHTARVWDAGPDKELVALSGHKGNVFDVAISPDGSRLATAGFDKTARVWDVLSGRLLLTLSGHTGQVLAVAYSPDGKRLATASNDVTAKVWDAATGQELLTLAGHTKAVGSGPFTGLLDVQFSPDGTRIATAGADGTARIWDALTGQLLRTLPGQGVRLNAVAYSRDGTRLATGSDEWDDAARVWDFSSGQLLQTFSGHTDRVWGVAFSPDGEHLATSSTDSTVGIWSLATGRRVLTLRGHTSTVIGVAYRPDGKQLASGGVDGTIRLWDPSTGKELLTLSSTGDPITRIAYSPNGAELAAASGDGNARVFLLGLSDLVALAHSRVTRGLSPAEC
ncbi:MAG: BTAD domain-containing putative transcriptional regulator, partial [Rudaea sp.]